MSRFKVFRISLRFFFLVIAGLCAWIAWWSHVSKHQQRAVNAIIARGGRVRYEGELSKSGQRVDWTSVIIPQFLIDTLGDDYFYQVEGVGIFPDAEHPLDEQLRIVAAIPNIKSLAIWPGAKNRQNLSPKSRHPEGLSDASAVFVMENFQSLNSLSLLYARFSDEMVHRLANDPGLSFLQISRHPDFGGDRAVSTLNWTGKPEKTVHLKK